jgi:hypothetical protein
MNINSKTMAEFLAQAWLEGELPISNSVLSEVLQRIGAHIYEDYQAGNLTWQEAEDSLQALNVCEDLWLGMPEIPEAL